MKFSVLALDYDGTIAHEGILHPDVRASIEEARLRSIAVVLVTGRILSDFKKIQLDLGIFDAVVAENGAVLAFPQGRTRLLRRPPPTMLLDELRHSNIDFTLGDCVLQADASSHHPGLARKNLGTQIAFAS